MTDGWPSGDLAEEANDLFASSYDDFNYRYLNARWTGTLLARAKAAGLQGDRLLDVGCGTGLSFIPMLRRGWRVTACDVSSVMVEIARSKVGDRAKVLIADMRDLPVLGSFDLAWAVNDAMNYLLTAEELEAALRGMRSNLAEDGVVVFDMNTLDTYRTFFSEEVRVEENGRRLVWSGRAKPEATYPGAIAEAHFEAKGEPGSAHLHRQRHFPEEQVLAAIEAAGLICADVAGELEGDLSDDLNEETHSKAVYVCKVRP